MANKFKQALEESRMEPYGKIFGTTGRTIRLLILYNKKVVKRLSAKELHQINPTGTYRSPLLAKFKHLASQRKFLFVLNHLARGSEKKRHWQAKKLNKWGKQQSLPVVAAGDYNFDWHAENGDSDHDLGYDLMTAKDVFHWMRPEKTIATHCSDYNSVLDFFFTANMPTSWIGKSWVPITNLNDCPDTEETSDHRPVKATFFL